MPTLRTAKQELSYVVDLDERGSFKAHVEDSNGKEIYTLSNEEQDEDGSVNCGGLWLVAAGYMKHSKDSSGLHEYLIEMGVVLPYSTLHLVDARAF